MDAISDQLAQALEKLLVDRGFRLPINFAMIAIDGSLLAGTYSQGKEGLTAAFTCQHFANDEHALMTPINIIFTDARGDAARIHIIEDERAGAPELY